MLSALTGAATIACLVMSGLGALGVRIAPGPWASTKTWGLAAGGFFVLWILGLSVLPAQHA